MVKLKGGAEERVTQGQNVASGGGGGIFQVVPQLGLFKKSKRTLKPLQPCSVGVAQPTTFENSIRNSMAFAEEWVGVSSGNRESLNGSSFSTCFGCQEAQNLIHTSSLVIM